MRRRLKPEPGLYAIDRQGSLAKQPHNVSLPASDDPYLVLLHGTFSTTGSSFGRLFRSAEWMELSDVYASRIVGLNHRTLSESPAQNALDLVKQLPPKARLHLLTHSRGGLVGELLALGPLPADALNLLALAGRPIEEIKALRDLADLLAAKQLRVERFVRVACPVRGTILASERLDRYLFVLLNLIGLIPAVDETLIYPFAGGRAHAPGPGAGVRRHHGTTRAAWQLSQASRAGKRGGGTAKAHPGRGRILQECLRAEIPSAASCS